jgi:hypothetical protein
MKTVLSKAMVLLNDQRIFTGRLQTWSSYDADISKTGRVLFFFVLWNHELTDVPVEFTENRKLNSNVRKKLEFTENRKLNSNFREKLDSVSGVYGKQEVKLPRYVCKFMVQEIA